MSEFTDTPPESWNWDTTDPTVRAIVAYFSDNLMQADTSHIDPQAVADRLMTDRLIVTNLVATENAIARSRAMLSSSLFNPANVQLLDQVAQLAGYSPDDIEHLHGISARLGTIPERTLSSDAREELELSTLQLASSAEARMQVG